MKLNSAVRALLFDMDGLLLDTEDIHIRAYMELCRQLGKPQPFEALKRFIGLSHHVTVTFLTDDLGFKHLDKEELILREQAIYFEILAREKPHPFPGVREMFKLADERGLKRGLVSSSNAHQVAPTMEVVLGHLDCRGCWKEYFQTICTGDRLERLKPHPDPYLLAAKELGLHPSECVVFEDSPAGVQAAHAAGCRVVAIPNIYLTHDEVVQGRTPHVYRSLLDAHANLAAFLD